MPRKLSEKGELCRAFLQDNPEGTFSDFNTAHPDTGISGQYFASLKSLGKKKASKKPDAMEAKEKKVKKQAKKAFKKEAKKAAPKRKARAATKGKNGTDPLSKRLEDLKGFTAWIEAGTAKNYIGMLKSWL